MADETSKGPARYDAKAIEAKWQKKWLEDRVFAARDGSKKPKYYQLETFPYPSAAGLHMGHPKGFTAEDIHARYMRMKGREVLYTIGWDAFGLPTENYAIKVGKSPKQVAAENIENFRKQVWFFGFSYDWDREINTSAPEYYKWTQWLFIQLFKKNLAYRREAKVNWCPNDQTVLANEQVIDGKCERCGAEIEERDMQQWFLRITDYADRLLADLKGLDWPSPTVKRQEDWIGRSVGAEIDFPLVAGKEKLSPTITVFTTRPDTIFGATYLVLAPEHEAVKALRSHITNQEDVAQYVDAALKKTERMRQEDAREKTGVEIKGIYAINPANQEKIPVWIADYVLGGYGTGAIMAVPAHDTRDFDFAKKFRLPVRQVIASEKGAAGTQEIKEAYTEKGFLVNSGRFDGMDSDGAKEKITKAVKGRAREHFKLRDWSVSRQRYWGAPIPMIHCAKCGIVPVPDDQLPVLLPDDVDYRPKGKPPLASSASFMNVKCPQCAGDAARDPETLDTFVDSSWYFLRYTDPKNADEIFNKKKVKHWLPVDLYVIGAEHTVLHLLYARFITKFLHDEGYVAFVEPFVKLRHQGLLMGPDGQKMSKSKGNVVNPDEVVGKFGADVVRTYLMFMGPFEDTHPWDEKGILGIERFAARVARYAEKATERGAPQGHGLLHKTIKKVGEDIEGFKFNTAIAALMILLNDLENAPPLTKEEFALFVKILHPFMPHLAQELWARMGNASYLDFEPWPAYDPALAVEKTVTLVFQVNGKLRDTVTADASITKDAAEALALANEKVKAALAGRPPQKVIYVDKKLVNIVVA